MKKVILFVSLAIMLIACGNTKEKTDCAATPIDSIATEMVPAAATEVLPAAAPSKENGGKVATEVIPNE